MSNRNSRPLLDLISQNTPDIVIAMEVDTWWNNELSPLKATYPHSKHAINEVAYGLVLYSKFKIDDVTVAYLNNKNVPSFELTIRLSDDKKFILHALHPVPPTFFRKLPDNEGQQENALKKIGAEISDAKLPIVVAGDLNDAVWSRVDNLTQTDNILFDVRVGRGFYNTFNANNYLMRWPLDHVFVSKEFKVKKIQRLTTIDSDHFPLLVELVL